MSMLRFSVKARVQHFLRPLPPPPLRTLTFTRRNAMADGAVRLQAIWFSKSGQWEHTPHLPYEIDAPYAAKTLPTSLILITWNVDFAQNNASPRLTAALDHLQFHAFPEYNGGQPPPCIILLQEISSPEAGWPQGARYGTATLVARCAPLAGSACVPYEESHMCRNALVTDVLVGGAEPHARVLRVVNTHLESLPEGTQRRVSQMGVVGRLLKEAGIVGGIVGGDMNAIAPSDEALAEENGLADAWERTRSARGDDGEGDAGEGEEEEDGTTWGYQPRSRFPPGRLDKILYTESDGFEVRDVRRLAVGLRMPGGAWVSDHYGLICKVEARQTTPLEGGD
ncbi:Endonuclease/exonuclease/phosphatase [Russula brevipes]|nr:Endonuclease/exonuclease/phosphatase [Russula brevipes]